MRLRNLLTLAIPTLVLGFATLAAIPRAEAALTLTVEEFTDDTFSTSLGGYTVTSSSSTPSDSVSFRFTDADGASVDGGTLSDFGTPSFSGLFIDSDIQTDQFSSFSQLVDNETQAENAGTSTRYIQVVAMQDLFDSPDTDPLEFSIDQNVNENVTMNGAESLFKGEIDTGDDMATLGFEGPGDFGPISTPVANSSGDDFKVTTTMRLELTPDGNITTTGTAAIFPVPEPSSFAVALAAGLPLVGIGWLRRRRNSLERT